MVELMIQCHFAFTVQPVYLKDWEMHVQYKIHGSGKKNLHGDGIAIWYTKERLNPGNASSCQNRIFVINHFLIPVQRFGNQISRLVYVMW